MEPTDLDRAIESLANASDGGVSSYMGVYENNFKILQQLNSNRQRRVGEINPTNMRNSIDLIKVGAILNDLSFLSFPMNGAMNIHWLTGAGVKLLLGLDSFSIWYREPIPPALRDALEKQQISIGFGMADDPDAEATLKLIRPLIEGRSIIPRPTRLVMYLHETRPDGGRNFGTLEARARAGVDNWDIRTSPDVPMLLGNVALEQTPPQPHDHPLCEVLIPFVENIEPTDIASILRDEADVLHEFRAGIRALIDEAILQGRNLPEILQDVVRPKVANLERRFRSIVSMTRLRLSGATVGTATLSLVSLLDTGLGAAIMALGGAAGMGAFTREYASGLEQIGTLKNDPTYLLWRLSKISS
jgi:hypothetical protein